MANIDYIALGVEDLEVVGPLWLRLQEHHSERSTYFADHLRQVSWDKRKEGLCRKARDGQLRIDMVRDRDADRYVGYCLASLSPEQRGEIESIFIEAAYRRHGIGDTLMRRALQWLDAGGAKIKVLGVAVGNEEVLSFYRRYGFVPRTTILQQIPESRS